jgi:CheY-like chemotaxis protein
MAPGSVATIMVIGGDPSFCYLMGRYIRKSGHRMVFASQSEDALELARREKPDAIVLEVDLPGTFGWSVLKGLKSGEQTRCIPVMLCSWKDDDEESWSTDHNAETFLRKPLLYKDFIATLDQLGIHSEVGE